MSIPSGISAAQAEARRIAAERAREEARRRAEAARAEAARAARAQRAAEKAAEKLERKQEKCCFDKAGKQHAQELSPAEEAARAAKIASKVVGGLFGEPPPPSDSKELNPATVAQVEDALSDLEEQREDSRDGAGNWVSSNVLDVFSDRGENTDEEVEEAREKFDAAMEDGSMTVGEANDIIEEIDEGAKELEGYQGMKGKVASVTATVATVAAGVAVTAATGGLAAPAAIAAAAAVGAGTNVAVNATIQGGDYTAKKALIDGVVGGVAGGAGAGLGIATNPLEAALASKLASRGLSEGAAKTSGSILGGALSSGGTNATSTLAGVLVDPTARKQGAGETAKAVALEGLLGIAGGGLGGSAGKIFGEVGEDAASKLIVDEALSSGKIITRDAIEEE